MGEREREKEEEMLSVWKDGTRLMLHRRKRIKERRERNKEGERKGINSVIVEG